ncbi:uncharacterized protein LOC108157086 [Drosophila miranda]|uniref:uncharacterized protein LOC108157086 n=1 Tax=Drosophila miranda TaxID=7229 RepID=UPI0007E5D4EF|nr:uncharacterized protein LOC108157086 [Drosophila miranda]
MSDTEDSASMSDLLKAASELSDSFGQLIFQIDGLLLDAHVVDSEISRSCNYRHEQLIKHLADKDEEAVELRENLELKATVEEYIAGVQTIVAKYKEHCQGDILLDSYNLREKYMASLQEIVNGQDERIDRMFDVMKDIGHMEDQETEQNQELIRRLFGENEMMRCQLQINNDGGFPKGPHETNEIATQFDLNDWTPDASSMISFMSCLSQDVDDSDSLSGCSVVSQVEVNRFIEEALSKDNDSDESFSSSEYE